MRNVGRPQNNIGARGHPRDVWARLMTSLGTWFYSEDGLDCEVPMIDILYILTAVVFFALCWAFTKACDRL